MKRENTVLLPQSETIYVQGITFYKSVITTVVSNSRQGWKKAILKLIQFIYGHRHTYNISL